LSIFSENIIKVSMPINNARYDPLENVKIRLIRDIKSKDALSLSSSKKVLILPEIINL
tara:strand:+ start:446 stop:619 length:174 start_codon:yes stop_codon:yes gene_type:complete